MSCRLGPASRRRGGDWSVPSSSRLAVRRGLSSKRSLSLRSRRAGDRRVSAEALAGQRRDYGTSAAL
ncbi:unnamed protein product [Caretta caretta]